MAHYPYICIRQQFLNFLIKLLQIDIRSKIRDRLNVFLVGASAQMKQHVVLQISRLAETTTANVTSERP